jgi:CRISPR-associated protein Cmr6
MRAGPDFIAAVPKYVGNRFDETPPGHRFRLYFEFWDSRWGPPREAKLDVLKTVASFPQNAMDHLTGLIERQQKMARRLNALSILATSTAPFSTGLGIEHPIENGFAFLDPYGLPYLPGSSIKGVLRRAAEELALFEADAKGWTIPAVWWLFGFDGSAGYLAQPYAKHFLLGECQKWRDSFVEKTKPDDELLEKFIRDIGSQLPPQTSRKTAQFTRQLQSSEELRRAIHIKGALDFWDAFPKPPKREMKVDIMNPHFTHYYQQGQPPGDWGSPTPIFFLTLPVGTEFVFHVRLLERKDLPPWILEEEKGVPRWKRLVEEAMTFAFQWLGFGAKSAVGYGRMRRLEKSESQRQIGAKETPFHEPSAHEPPPSVKPVAGTALAKLQERIKGFPSGKSAFSELEELLNLLSRNYKDPMAPALASELWAKVKDKPYAHKFRKNPIVWELVEKGGGS